MQEHDALDDDADLLDFLAGDDGLSSVVDDATTTHPVAAAPASNLHNADASLYATAGPTPVHGDGASSSTGAFTVTQSKRAREDDWLGGEGETERRRRAPRSDVFTEPRTKIRISQGTTWLDQLHVLTAQYTYCALGSLAQGLRLESERSTSALPCCTIAAVTNKSDARVASGKSTRPYGFLRLWSMRGPSGQGGDEASLLVCDAAFREQYGRIDVGSVLFLCKLELLPPRQGQDAAGSGPPPLRCTDSTAVRILGYAADLKPCQSINKSNGEQCKRLVNVAECGYCSFHVGDLKKALTKASNVATKRQVPGGGPAPTGGPPTVPLVFRPSALTTANSTPGRTLVALGGLPSALGGSGALKQTAGGGTGAIPGMQQYLGGGTSSSGGSQPHAKPFPTPFPVTPRVAPAASGAPAQSSRTSGVPKQGETFIATRGNTVVSTSRSAQQPGTMVAGGAYAGVVRGTMEVTGVDRSVVGGGRLSTSALAVTHRGRDVLAAAINATDEQDRSAQLYEALAGSRCGTSPTATATATVAAAATTASTGQQMQSTDALGAVPKPTPWTKVAVPTTTIRTVPEATARAPTSSATVAVPRARSQFAPLTGASRLDEDMGPQPVRRGQPSSVGGHASAATAIGRSLLARQGQGGDGALRGTAAGAGAALSSMGRAADAVSSRNDALRMNAERDRLAASAQRLLEVDRALSALDKIHERPVRAIHCKTCRRYSYSKPQDCVSKQHVLVQEQTVQRFLECEHCRHKVTVLGDVNAALVLPSCPRCKRAASWERSSAAPAHFTMRQATNARGRDDEDGRGEGCEPT